MIPNSTTLPKPLPATANDVDYIDIHSHRTTTNHQAIINLDYHSFANIAVPEQFFSAGIHPWCIEKLHLDPTFRKLGVIAIQPKMLAVGECGLDRNITTPLPLQIDVFQRQIELSEHIGKPLIVHCVRAFAELLHLKKQLHPKQIWIIHGFRGKPALAKQLLHHACYLSFGKALLHDNQTRLSMAATPSERVFLETDEVSDASIGEIYATAAKILDLDLVTLQRQIVANFNRVFA